MNIKSLHLYKTIILLCIFCFIVQVGIFSQTSIKGTVVEKDSKLPIAFASVVYQKQAVQKGVITDIRGKFEVKESDIASITATCVGYKQKTVSIIEKGLSSNLIIELETNAKEIDEVIVTLANNPAIPIIRNVLKNKAKNNFEQYEKYSYRCYFKTIIDIKLAADASSNDSAKVLKNEHLKKHAAFISESILSCAQVEGRIENKIVAQKSSGFTDPMLAQIFASTFHHVISFYNENISLFEIPISSDKSVSDYVSPLANSCLNSYNFVLAETIINGNDSTFSINFFPKKGKNFNSLKGTLFISSNGYAIKNIVVEPVEKGLIGFKFRQDYELIQNRWFPVKLDEEIGWISQKINKNINAYPVYQITAKIDSIKYDSEISKSNINLEKVSLNEKTIKNSDSILNASRPDSLTTREKLTFQFMDSVGQKHNFDYWTKLLPKLTIGRIPVKWIDLDIYNIYNYNRYEGNRLGLGLFTNEKISKWVSLGGFAGYGLKDKTLKYGSQLTFEIDKKNEVQIKFSYQNNLKETGLDLQYSSMQQSLGNYMRSYIGSQYDKVIEYRAEICFRILRNIKISTALSLNELEPTYAYQFKSQTLGRYRTDGIYLSAKYAYGEDISTLGNQKIVNNQGNPVIYVIYKRGIDVFGNKSLRYNHLESTIDYTAYKGRIGQSNFRLAGGLIDKSVPYGLLFTGEGSKNKDIPLSINNSFQTMTPYEFLSDRYINLFYSHNFGSLLFKTKKFKPQFVIIQNSGWGTLKNKADHSIAFKEKDKIYLESGLAINNILKLNYVNIFYVGFGAGGFYRYGYYGHSHPKDNLAIKLTINITLK